MQFLLLYWNDKDRGRYGRAYLFYRARYAMAGDAG